MSKGVGPAVSDQSFNEMGRVWYEENWTIFFIAVGIYCLVHRTHDTWSGAYGVLVGLSIGNNSEVFIRLNFPILLIAMSNSLCSGCPAQTWRLSTMSIRFLSRVGVLILSGSNFKAEHCTMFTFFLCAVIRHLKSVYMGHCHSLCSVFLNLTNGDSILSRLVHPLPTNW